MSSKEVTAPNGASPVAQVLRPIRGRLVVACLLSAVGSMLTLVPLAGIAEIARAALGSNGIVQDAVWPIVGISIASLLAGMLLVSAGEMAAHLADNHITHHLRLQITRRLAQVPLGWFTSRVSGEGKQAMQDDIATLHSLTAHFFTTTARAVGVIAISLIYLFAMDWRLALIAIVPFPCFFLFFGRAIKASAGNMQEFITGLGRINNAVIEFVNGIPVVKAFGATGRAHAGYREAVDAFALAFAGFTRPLVSSMANANAMIAPVDVLPFALAAPGISAPLLLLHYLTHDLNNATAAAQRVQTLLQTPVLAQPEPGQCQLPASSELCVEHLGYSYDGQHQVLSDISFTLKPGTVTAIVGASGSGKSTLARLLLRFFDPTQGRITLGGVDLRQIETSELYRRIGFVLQEVRLIHASVRENIALGRPSASAREVEDAARAANIHERILALPRGYDSVLGEDGQLSGGEQQRISIARAVLLAPSVLVLDEATAAADAENEVLIQEALSRFAQGRSLLVIAHRLDTVMHADHIIVLENGAIAEQGSHAELLARNDRYARLWILGGYTSSQEAASC